MERGILFSALFVICAAATSIAGQVLEVNGDLTKSFGSSLKRFENDVDKKKKRHSVSEARPLGVGDETIRIDTELVINEVLVQAKNGNVVKGLTLDDFLVSEDYVPQKIEVFALGGSSTVPRSIILIIDYSYSELPYISTSVEAAKVLVDKLHPNDQMALVTDNIELLSDFTSDKDILKAKLDSLRSKALDGEVGKSKQYSALLASLNELFSDRALRPIVLFQTDGDQFSEFTGCATFDESYGPGPRGVGEAFHRLLSALEETGATIYTIIPGPRFAGLSGRYLMDNAEIEMTNAIRRTAEFSGKPFDIGQTRFTQQAIRSRAITRQRDETALEYLSRVTGGLTEHLENSKDADGVYSKILSEMNQRYLIGYYPTDSAKNGKRRKVEIRVRDHSDYAVWGGKTYIAASGADK